MKSLKISLTAVVAAIILAISTGAYAHGSQVDTMDRITMPGSLNDGKGNVSTQISGEMSYQFVEISSSEYNTIVKREAQYDLVKAYIDGADNYDSLAEKYEKTYNQTANEIQSEYGIQFDAAGLGAIKGEWTSDLKTYNDSNWVKANGTTISLDLTSFEGTKYFVGWVKVGNEYDAEVYKATGSKKDEEKPAENTNTNTPTNTPAKTQNKNTPNTIKTNKTTASKLPKTGANDVALILVAVATAASGVAYVRYKKVK